MITSVLESRRRCVCLSCPTNPRSSKHAYLAHNGIGQGEEGPRSRDGITCYLSKSGTSLRLHDFHYFQLLRSRTKSTCRSATCLMILGSSDRVQSTFERDGPRKSTMSDTFIVLLLRASTTCYSSSSSQHMLSIRAIWPVFYLPYSSYITTQYWKNSPTPLEEERSQKTQGIK